MKHWSLSCTDWLAFHTTANDQKVPTRLAFQRLNSDPHLLAFASRWVDEALRLPERQRGKMMGWWETAVYRDTVLMYNIDHLQRFITWITVMEYLGMRGRRDLWDQYLKGREGLHPTFLKELRTYEKKSSIIDRALLERILYRNPRRGGP